MSSKTDVVLPPLLEPEIEGTAYHPDLKICYQSKVHFTAEQMQCYARAAVLADRQQRGGENSDA